MLHIGNRSLQFLLVFNFPLLSECQLFSIPRAFNNSLGRAAAGRSIMQLLFQVLPEILEHNGNYSVEKLTCIGRLLVFFF